MSSGAGGFGCIFHVAGPCPYSSPVSWFCSQMENGLRRFRQHQEPAPKTPEANTRGQRQILPLSPACPAVCGRPGVPVFLAVITALLQSPLQPSYQHRLVQAPVTLSRYPGHTSTHAAACSKGVQERNCWSKQAMGLCLLRRWRERQD